MNGYFKTVILLSAITALFMGVGFLLGGVSGMGIAFVIALLMNISSWWYSDKIVLSMYKARPLDEAGHKALVDMTKMMCERAGMSMPRLYLIDSAQPNAFATGRNPDNGVVAVTRGLIERLEVQEVVGVIAHELAHIKNRDTMIMTITATIAGALSMLANFAFFFGGGRQNGIGIIGVIILAIAAPIAASLVQMAISRAREFEADRIGAEFCGRPEWLASALAKISAQAEVIDNEAAEDNPATAHMFIINPLHAHAIDGLFSTHPPTQKRIERLQAMMVSV